HNPLLVGHHHVARIDDDATAADRGVHAAGTDALGRDRRGAARAEATAGVAGLSHVPHSTVDDEAGDAATLGDRAHVAPGHRHVLVAGLDHEDVAGLGQ